MFCSTIIATIGRQSLDCTVKSVLAQQLTVPHEVIVVNDSGTNLPKASWDKDPRVRVIATNRLERSVARNTGAAIARGRFLHFIDDDDWLEPGGLKSLHKLTERESADLYYGAARIVDRDHRLLNFHAPTIGGNCFTQVMAGEWIPMHSSIIKRSTFWTAGGFGLSVVWREDADLVRKVARIGTLAGTLETVATIVLGETDSTTGAQHLADARARKGREVLLATSGAWRRLWRSAKTPYWHGRIVRLYATSAFWNARRLRLSTTFRQLFMTLAAYLRSGLSRLRPAFWRALTRRHSSLSESQRSMSSLPSGLQKTLKSEHPAELEGNIHQRPTEKTNEDSHSEWWRRHAHNGRF